MTATTEQSADGMLFTGEETVNATIAEYKTRLGAVREAIDTRHQHLQLRYATDEYHQTADRIRGAAGFLAGDYDATYCSVFNMTLEDWRIHYALDSLRAALHNLVWAEHYAGLRDREATRDLDPWNQR